MSEKKSSVEPTIKRIIVPPVISNVRYTFITTLPQLGISYACFITNTIEVW